jgi:hypothetical protein
MAHPDRGREEFFEGYIEKHNPPPCPNREAHKTQGVTHPPGPHPPIFGDFRMKKRF